MASVGLVELPFRIIILHNRKLKVTKSTPDHKQRDVVFKLMKDNTQKEEHLNSQRYYINELYKELEDFMQEQREIYQVDKTKEYKPQKQILPDFNMDKAVHAMKLIDFLKQFVEIDNRKLGFF